jgi:hypothetical protein
MHFEYTSHSGRSDPEKPEAADVSPVLAGARMNFGFQISDFGLRA